MPQVILDIWFGMCYNVSAEGEILRNNGKLNGSIDAKASSEFRWYYL